MTDALPSWYTPDPTIAAPASPAASSAPPPDWYTPEPAAPAVAPAQPGPTPTTLGTGGYILGRAVEAGAPAAASVMTNPLGDPTGGLDIAPGVDPSTAAATFNKKVLGTPTGDLGAPANAVQRYGGDLAATVASNPALAIMAPGATAGGSLASTAASDANAATGGILPDWLARLIGGFAGGAATSGASSFLKGRAALPSEASPTAGLATNKAIDRAVTQSDRFGETPIGSYQAPAAQTAAAMGDAATPAQIGGRILNKADAYIEGQKKAAADDFSKIEAGIPTGARADMHATVDLLTQPGEGPPLDAPLAGQIAARLNKNGANGLGETMPYGDLKAWRTEVGSDLSSATGQHRAALSRLYGALTTDMENMLAAHGGPEAVDAFRNANEAFGRAKDFIRYAIGGLQNEGLSPENAFASLAANPAQTATRLRALVANGVLDQKDIGAIARQVVTQMGQDARGVWDPTRFTQAAIALHKASPEAEALLFRNTPERAAAYDAMIARSAALDKSVAPLARANPPDATAMEFLKKAARGLTLGTALGHLPVVGPEAGELVGGIMGIGEGAPAAGSPLYRLPRRPLADQLFELPGVDALTQGGLTAPSRAQSSGSAR